MLIAGTSAEAIAQENSKNTKTTVEQMKIERSQMKIDDHAAKRAKRLNVKMKKAKMRRGGKAAIFNSGAGHPAIKKSMMGKASRVKAAKMRSKLNKIDQ